MVFRFFCFVIIDLTETTKTNVFVASGKSMTQVPDGQHQSQQDWALQILVASLYECKRKDDKNVRFCLSLQGSRAEPLPLFSLPAWLANTLDVVGISLAVLDFTGASRKIEAALAKYRDYEQRAAQDFLQERASIRDWRKHLDWKIHARRLRLSLVMIVPAALVIWLWGTPEKLLVFVPDWPSWVWWTLLACSPILYAIEYVVSHIIGMTIGHWYSMVAWRFFWLLSRPRAGVMGTIGLAMAFFDTGANIVSRLMQA